MSFNDRWVATTGEFRRPVSLDDKAGLDDKASLDDR